MVPFLLVRLLAEISCGHNTMTTKILGEQKQHQLTKNTFMIKNATFFHPSNTNCMNLLCTVTSACAELTVSTC